MLDGHSVQIRQQVWEKDWDGWFIPDGDDHIASYTWSRGFVAAAGSTVITPISPFPTPKTATRRLPAGFVPSH